MAANKLPGIRASLCYDRASARNAREHNAANLLTLGSRLLTPSQAEEVLRTWLATPYADVRQLCAEARHHRFAAVCVNPYWVPLAARELRGAPVQVCTVVGFPLGATTTASKCAEAAEAISLGATEIDMVLNVGALKAGDLAAVQADIAAVAATCHRAGALLKVILETALLSDPEKIAACHASQNAGADFVKTSTGFAKSGATPADVALLRSTVGPSLGVKASGGIRSLANLQAMAAAGASRIGASASVHILAQAGQP
jgi:deoxyribose-phosphate aldolase